MSANVAIPIAGFKDVYDVGAVEKALQELPPSANEALRALYEKMMRLGGQRFTVKPSALPAMERLFDELPNFCEVLADTSCGYGCIATLPEGAKGFTTIELKANFLGTAREGAIRCRSTPIHLGRTTQVWDSVITAEAGGAKIALFRCTQMVLWPK